jgi:hypothetical protein
MENSTEVTLATLSWEITNYPPHSPDLAPSDFHLFGPMKVHPVGQKCQTDDELKHGVLNWLRSWYETFYAAGISNLPGQWEECVSVKGEYLEKE